jgi:hypothetical protein
LDIEQLWIQPAEAGLTAMIKTDHETRTVGQILDILRAG